MSTVRELHDKAMILAQRAMIARHSDNIKQAEQLAKEALQYEMQAAELVPEKKESEPTRSILYKSAASLAYQCKELSTAQRLIAKGLSGYPPPKIEAELKTLQRAMMARSTIIDLFEKTMKTVKRSLSRLGEELPKKKSPAFLGRPTIWSVSGKVRASSLSQENRNKIAKEAARTMVKGKTRL